MTNENLLSLLGSAFGFIGTIILAFSLSSILKVFEEIVLAYEILAQTLNNTGSLVFTGIDTHFKKAKTKTSLWTYLGLAMVIIGFFLQTLSVLINAYCSPKN